MYVTFGSRGEKNSATRPCFGAKKVGVTTLLNRIVFCLALASFFPIAASTPPTPQEKEKKETWWSLKPVVRPALPEGATENPIDRFIAAEQRARGLKAVGPAPKLALLRRVYLDLIGIPPSPSEQEAFLKDESADAYEKVVDRLLADEQHAVRYAPLAGCLEICGCR